jgi:hypothetical protein
MRIRFTFLQTGESAEAVLRMGDAPVTCQTLLNRLPAAGVCHHAAYSGSEAVLILPEPLRIAPENATYEVHTGDIGFTWFAPGMAYGVTEEFAEICWFYDQDARPSMHEGPAPVNIFARFVGDPAAFYARSRAMRRSGITSLLIEKLGVRDAGMPVAYHDPRREAPLKARRVTIGDRPLAVGCAHGSCFALASEDQGASWRVAGEIMAGESGSLAVSSDETLWAAAGYATPGPIRVAHSPNRGEAWQLLPDGGLIGARPSIAVMPEGGIVVLFETGSGISAARWTERTSWTELHLVIEEPDAHRPIALPCDDGRLICAFTLGEGPYATHVTTMEDEG